MVDTIMISHYASYRKVRAYGLQAIFEAFGRGSDAGK
jgi:hypothetical protein